MEGKGRGTGWPVARFSFCSRGRCQTSTPGLALRLATVSGRAVTMESQERDFVAPAVPRQGALAAPCRA